MKLTSGFISAVASVLMLSSAALADYECKTRSRVGTYASADSTFVISSNRTAETLTLGADVRLDVHFYLNTLSADYYFKDRIVTRTNLWTVNPGDLWLELTLPEPNSFWSDVRCTRR